MKSLSLVTIKFNIPQPLKLEKDAWIIDSLEKSERKRVDISCFGGHDKLQMFAESRF